MSEQEGSSQALISLSGFGYITIITIIGGLFFFLFNYIGSDGKKVAEQFIYDLTDNRADQAKSSLHPALIKELKPNYLESINASTSSYTSVSWSSIEVDNNQYFLEGSASTVSGCTSNYEVELIKAAGDNPPLITFFHIKPLCVK